MRKIFTKPVIIGLVAVATILLAIWGFHFLKGSNLLNRNVSYYSVYEKIGGLQESAPVTLHGYKVGLVGSVTYIPKGQGLLLVELVIRPDIQIPDQSVARIYSSDLMGTKAISLDFIESPGFYQAGDTLPSGLELDLKEEVNAQVAPLKARIEKLMLSFDSVLVGFQEVFNEKTRKNLTESFQSITRTLNTINKTTGQLDEIVTSEKGKLKQILSHIEGISGSIYADREKLGRIIENFSAISDSLAAANLAQTIRNTDKVLSEVAGLLEKANKGEGSVGLLFSDPGLYRNLESSSLQLNHLLKDIRENPKRYIQFSLFDFNRPVSGSKSVNTQSMDHGFMPVAEYRVQFKASVQPITQGEIPDSIPFQEYREGKWYKYQSLPFFDKEDAIRELGRIRKVFPDAFLIRQVPDMEP